MDPVMLQIGPIAIRWYGFLIALGVLIGSIWATRSAEKRGLDPEKLLRYGRLAGDCGHYSGPSGLCPDQPKCLFRPWR